VYCAALRVERESCCFSIDHALVNSNTNYNIIIIQFFICIWCVCVGNGRGRGEDTRELLGRWSEISCLGRRDGGRGLMIFSDGGSNFLGPP